MAVGGSQLRHFDGVVQLDIGEYVADAVLGELLDVKGGGQPVQANAVGRQFDVEIAHAIAGASEDMGFELLPKSREIKSGHSLSPSSLPSFVAAFALGPGDYW